MQFMVYVMINLSHDMSSKKEWREMYFPGIVKCFCTQNTSCVQPFVSLFFYFVCVLRLSVHIDNRRLYKVLRGTTGSRNAEVNSWIPTFIALNLAIILSVKLV